MAIDNDLSALLPDPPPPRPARREAALVEAMRRFDGQGERSGPPRAAARPARVRPGWARPQLAALASAVLVVLVSVPVWWTERDRFVPEASPPAPPAARSALELEPAPAAAPELRQQPSPATPQSAEADMPAPAAPAEGVASMELAQDAVAPPPPPAPAAAPPRPAPALRAAPLAPATQRARQAVAEAASDEEDRSIVVTGSRVERGDFALRAPIPAVADAAPLDGAWNACTLNDPRRNPTACRSSAGRAAAQLDDGLALAWQGDLDRAIQSFGRAITAQPGFALAYLNRGLAWQAKGDLRRALADLDRAVARDRTGARGYYHRSLLHRARGDTAKAEADAKRAIALDPGYAAALP